MDGVELSSRVVVGKYPIIGAGECRNGPGYATGIRGSFSPSGHFARSYESKKINKDTGKYCCFGLVIQMFSIIYGNDFKSASSSR